MLTIEQFQSLLGSSLFGGDAMIAGLVIFAVTLAILFVVLQKNLFASLLVAIPVTFIYSAIGVLSADLMVIMIIVCVLGLTAVGKRTLGE